jgi:dienelactone hydrolase
MENQIDEYVKFTFEAPTDAGHTILHDVYRKGRGAPIVIIQELPGIGPQTMRLADLLIRRGFEVFIPHLFGPIGKLSVVGNTARVMCMRKEFSLFSTNKSSPIVDWLKALCRVITAHRSFPGVGVIGMCLTGNFALSLIADDSVLAAVASQPSLPLLKQASLHMSAQEIEDVKAAIDASAPIKAYRFKRDWMSSAEKFDCIGDKLNTDGKIRIDLRTLPGDGHSVLTLDFVDEEGHPTRLALEEIFDYFESQLGSKPDPVDIGD